MQIPLGFNAKLMISGDEAKGVRDLTLNMDRTEIDVASRGGGDWEESVFGQIKASVDYDMLWDLDDPSFAVVASAFIANEPLKCQILDGPSGTGLEAWFGISSFKRDEKLKDALKANVTMMPAYKSSDEDDKPKWIEGTGGGTGITSLLKTAADVIASKNSPPKTPTA